MRIVWSGAVLGLALLPVVLGATTLPSASSLTGLNPGDSYAFVFVTSGTTAATSNSLATYNTFVQNAANSAGIGTSIGLTWMAVANTGGSPNRALDNAPVANTTKVYLLNGTMVANGGTVPFYSQCECQNHLAPINISELLTTISRNVWTGGNGSGTESGSGLLGSGSPVYGISTGSRSERGWADSWARINNASSSNQYSLYAVSATMVYNVAAVPEPASFVLLGLAGAALAVWRRRIPVR